MVRAFAARGYQQTKVYSWLSLEGLRALGRASAEVGLRMTGHCPDGVTYEEAIEAGMTCFEHLTGIGFGRLREGQTLISMRMGSLDAMKLLVEYLDLDSVRRLAADMAERQIWNCPTLIVW